MAKSHKNIVRDILKAHGLHDIEPNQDAVAILAEALQAAYREGAGDSDYDHTMAENDRY